MEPTDAQFLIVNALETLELLQSRFYFADRGVWYIETPSPVLPVAAILQSGDVVPVAWVQSDDAT